MASLSWRLQFCFDHGAVVPAELLSILLIWCKGTKEYGGFRRVTLSLLLEVLFSVLLAPVRMLFHTVFVVSVPWLGSGVEFTAA